MVSSTRTRYAKSGDVDIAYQVLGDGPIDLLVYTGSLVPIDCVDEEPSMARFQRRLGSFSRLIRFDRSGVGLSDRGSASAPPTHEEWVQDGMAVLDAVGSEHTAVFAPFSNSPEGVTMAATCSERVSHLVIVNGLARLASSLRTAFHGEQRQSGAAAATSLVVGVCDVMGGGLGGDSEGASDVFVGGTTRDEAHHLDLSIGKTGRPRVRFAGGRNPWRPTTGAIQAALAGRRSCLG